MLTEKRRAISNRYWFRSYSTLTLVVISISPIFAIIIITAVPYILHLTVPIIGASGAVAITPIVIAFTAIVLTWSIIPTTASRGGWGSSTAEGALTTSSRRSRSTITARVKSPRCRRRGTRPLTRMSAYWTTDHMSSHTSIFSTSSLPSRLLCIS